MIPAKSQVAILKLCNYEKNNQIKVFEDSYMNMSFAASFTGVRCLLKKNILSYSYPFSVKLKNDAFIRFAGNIIVRAKTMKELCFKLSIIREATFATPENLISYYAYKHRPSTLGNRVYFALVGEPKFSPEVDEAIKFYFDHFDKTAIENHIAVVKFQKLIKLNMEHSPEKYQTPESLVELLQELINKVTYD